MAQRKRKWQEKVWIIISLIAIVLMVAFTALPFLQTVAQ